ACHTRQEEAAASKISGGQGAPRTRDQPLASQKNKKKCRNNNKRRWRQRELEQGIFTTTTGKAKKDIREDFIGSGGGTLATKKQAKIFERAKNA
ncbi:unnamed protein product, partial [Amoebophrya sp. A25]